MRIQSDSQMGNSQHEETISSNELPRLIAGQIGVVSPDTVSKGWLTDTWYVETNDLPIATPYSRYGWFVSWESGNLHILVPVEAEPAIYVAVYLDDNATQRSVSFEVVAPGAIAQ